MAVRATVSDIRETYAVARPIESCGDLQKNESVTFSLAHWRGEDHELQCGAVIELHDTSLYLRGWRSLEARPVVFGDSEEKRRRS